MSFEKQQRHEQQSTHLAHVESAASREVQAQQAERQQRHEQKATTAAHGESAESRESQRTKAAQAPEATGDRGGQAAAAAGGTLEMTNPFNSGSDKSHSGFPGANEKGGAADKVAGDSKTSTNGSDAAAASRTQALTDPNGFTLWDQRANFGARSHDSAKSFLPDASDSPSPPKAPKDEAPASKKTSGSGFHDLTTGWDVPTS